MRLFVTPGLRYRRACSCAEWRTNGGCAYAIRAREGGEEAPFVSSSEMGDSLCMTCGEFDVIRVSTGERGPSDACGHLTTSRPRSIVEERRCDGEGTESGGEVTRWTRRRVGDAGVRAPVTLRADGDRRLRPSDAAGRPTRLVVEQGRVRVGPRLREAARRGGSLMGMKLCGMCGARRGVWSLR